MGSYHSTSAASGAVAVEMALNDSCIISVAAVDGSLLMALFMVHMGVGVES